MACNPLNRRAFLTKLLGGAAVGLALPAPWVMATAAPESPRVLHHWYKLFLKLVRHTPGYSPPVASRAFAYLGVAAYEAIASGSRRMISLAGQLNELHPLPKRKRGETYNEAAVLHAALTAMARDFFKKTGPTGARVLEKTITTFDSEIAAGADAAELARSIAYGKSVAEHVLEWSRGDGVAKMAKAQASGTSPVPKTGRWVPTSTEAAAQKPLLPGWGSMRCFAMPEGRTCRLGPPTTYSEKKSSAFYKEALEVYQTTKSLSAEQLTIANFWADAPMHTSTPPGHWVSIALQILERNHVGSEKSVDVMARLGIAVADAFIGCWQTKYEFDLLRPVTYIQKHIDASWKPPLSTPPFPEYPSGHSTQSGAAAVVLAAAFGKNFTFTDSTHEKEGLAPRTFKSFNAAAQEAAISRLYGGIHFRTAIERGIDQGKCIGAHAVKLKTRLA